MARRTARRNRTQRRSTKRSNRRSTKRSKRSKRSRRTQRRRAMKSQVSTLPYSYETTDDLPMNKLKMKVNRRAKFTKKRKSKKGPSPYNKFVKKMSPVLRNQNPGKSQPQIMKLIAQEWKKHNAGTSTSKFNTA